MILFQICSTKVFCSLRCLYQGNPPLLCCAYYSCLLIIIGCDGVRGILLPALFIINGDKSSRLELECLQPINFHANLIPKFIPLLQFHEIDIHFVSCVHIILSIVPCTVFNVDPFWYVEWHNIFFICFISGETRYIIYNKEGGGAGLRIAGGNHTGIFIAGVQDASPAQKEGVREGDEIIKVCSLHANSTGNSSDLSK